VLIAKVKTILSVIQKGAKCPMAERDELFKLAADGYKTMMWLEEHLEACGLEESLQHLVELRVSQVEGCALCLEMHRNDLRALGEMEYRLSSLQSWRESPYFTLRERAALGWTEAVTLATEDQLLSDDIFREALTQFNDKELSDLTYLATSASGWCRLCIVACVSPENCKSSRAPR
jgi:AhpD family alkylhydroperoxidase